MVCGWPVGCTAKFSKTTLEAASGRELNIQLSGNSSNCAFPQLETSVALCCVTKLHILVWPFILPNTRCTCVIIVLFNQLDMPHLFRCINYLGKGDMFTNRNVNKFVFNIFEKAFVHVKKFWGLLFQLIHMLLKKIFKKKHLPQNYFYFTQNIFLMVKMYKVCERLNKINCHSGRCRGNSCILRETLSFLQTIIII